MGLLPLEDQSGGALSIEHTLWGLRALIPSQPLCDLTSCVRFGGVGGGWDRGSVGAGLVVELPQLSDRQRFLCAPVERRAAALQLQQSLLVGRRTAGSPLAVSIRHHGLLGTGGVPITGWMGFPIYHR